MSDAGGRAGEAQAWYGQGAAALAAQRPAQAEAALWQCLALEPEHASALHLLGKLRAEQGRPEQALALQRASLRADPRLGWNAFAAGELLAAEKRWGEAAAAFRAAAAALPQQAWIGARARQAQGMELSRLFGGRRLGDGLPPEAYALWVERFETPGPPEAAAKGWADGQIGLLSGWWLDLAADAVLRPGARAWLAAWLQRRLAAPAEGAAGVGPPDLLVPDEDRLDAHGRRHDPWWKPGWVAESFWATPWLEGGAIWRRGWLEQQGLEPAAAGDDPEQRRLERWRWQLAALARGPRIESLGRILLHRRQNAADDPCRSEAHGAALAEALAQAGEPGVTVRAAAGPGPGQADPPAAGFRLAWPQPPSLRLSVVVLSRDRPDLLAQCLGSVEASRGPVRLEWLVVDNGSRLEATAALLRHWQERPGASCRRLEMDEPFHWSRLNNRAAAEAQGGLLLFLNNDVAVPPALVAAADGGWLRAMASQAQRAQIGCVGARLLYPPGSPAAGRIQHAGLLPGLGPGCEHPYRGLAAATAVHRGRAGWLSGWPAVTGACLMVRRPLFQAVGGFEPALPVEGNDVDFCLRLGARGLRHVVVPEATLWHAEAASRDALASGTWAPAMALLRQRWPAAMAGSGPWWPAACANDTTDGRPRELGGLDLP